MIRAGTVDDLSTIKYMLRLLRAEAPEMQDVPVDEGYVHDKLYAFLSGTDGIFVYDEGVGFVMGGVVSRWFDPRPVGVEELIYMLPVWRKMGRVIPLIKAFEDECVKRGAVKIFLGEGTGVHTEGVKRLYTRLGYRPSTFKMVKDIPCAVIR